MLCGGCGCCKQMKEAGVVGINKKLEFSQGKTKCGNSLGAYPCLASSLV